MARDLEWMTDALCADGTFDPDLWSAPGSLAKARARHICLMHCPVIQACFKTMKPGPDVVVYGVAHSALGRPMKLQPDTRVTCKLCLVNVDNPT